MRITDFSLSKGKMRLSAARRRFYARTRTQSLAIRLLLARGVREAHIDVSAIFRRKIEISTTMFNLNAYSTEMCLRDFRFRKEEIPIIARLCAWKGPTVRNRYDTDSITATCIMLRRMAAPCRSPSHFFFERIIVDERAEFYAKTIQELGGHLENCIGFIVGTRIQISRPGGDNARQRSMYSGHKRFHCLAFQTVTCPEGLIIHMYGPAESRKPDLVLYTRSALDTELHSHMLIEGKQYGIYGDSAYTLRPWMQTAFPRHLASSQQVQYNRSMNRVRTSVEWSYQEVKPYFKSQDFARKMRVGEGPVGMLSLCAILLRNFKTCLWHGGLSVHYFQCMPPFGTVSARSTSCPVVLTTRIKDPSWRLRAGGE
eukprot:IDg7193t1